MCVFRIPGDLQQVVFNVAAQSNDDWSTLFTMYATASYDSEKRKMLRGLASTQDTRSIVWSVYVHTVIVPLGLNIL